MKRADQSRMARDAMDVFDQGTSAVRTWHGEKRNGTGRISLEDVRTHHGRDARERRSFGRLEAIYEQRAAE
jgi:hypothetical protein